MNNQPFNRFILCYLLVLLLLLQILACGAEPRNKCGSIWITCPDLKRPLEVCDSCFLRSAETRSDILYFRFFDCESKKTLQSSVAATCEVR